jgi:hypothetical protein
MLHAVALIPTPRPLAAGSFINIQNPFAQLFKSWPPEANTLCLCVSVRNLFFCGFAAFIILTSIPT